MLRLSQSHRGFTLVELLVAIGTIAIVAAIAVPGVIRARISANEASALASLRVIHTSQSTFASECGGGGYATQLSDLIRPPAGSSHAFISPDLSTDPTVKSGYVVWVTQDNGPGGAVVLAAGTACNGATAATVTTYWAGAVPVHVGITGQRSFAIDRSGVLYQDHTGATIANPIPPATQRVQ